MSERVRTNNLIIVYDLPSEYQKGLDASMKNKVRSARVNSVRLLHSLGVMCTQSVILVSPNKINEVERTLNRVYRMYELLGVRSLKPTIKVLNLTNEQFTELTEFAKNILRDKCDNTIERLNQVIEELKEIDDEEQLTRMKYYLTREMKEFKELVERAESLGIVLPDFDLVISLYEKAIDICNKTNEIW